MRAAPALFLVLLVTIGISACADSGKYGRTVRFAAPSQKPDRDDDNDNNDDDAKILYYGQSADATDRQIITELVRSYYAAAAAENGALACRLLHPVLAETVTDDYVNSNTLRGTTCAAVLSKLFRLHHRKYINEAAVKVDLVRVDGSKGLAMLSFANQPAVRQILVRRYRNTWRLREIVDSIVE